ncbi:Gamma-aminobutyric acid receptor subunit pi [Turdus rufiventris]|nr:Gamma-aminobutyric acid receptor subunit pi [Turdus rufiventris]
MLRMVFPQTKWYFCLSESCPQLLKREVRQESIICKTNAFHLWKDLNDAAQKHPELFHIRSMQIPEAEGNSEILPPTIQKIIKGYNKYLRPFFDNGPVSVGMSMDIASIDTISEINMDYTATIFLRQRWTDERLCFDGNKSLSLDGRLVEMLWVPDTFIVDSKKSFLHDVTVENRLIRIYPNGTVLYAISKTPFGILPIGFSPPCCDTLEGGYNINDVTFYWTRGNDSVRGLDTLQLAQYTVEDHFTSVTEAVYETGRYPKLVFHFELKRNILYFILETYVPSILLVVLSWVSFWISQSSVPARICIGVTTVLTMTTLMMGARTSLPNANCFIKAIDVYLGICFSFIFGALLEYAVTHFCTLHQLSSKELPKIVDDDDEEEKNGVLAAVTNSCNAPDNMNEIDSNKSKQSSTDRKRERSQHSVWSTAISNTDKTSEDKKPQMILAPSRMCTNHDPDSFCNSALKFNPGLTSG